MVTPLCEDVVMAEEQENQQNITDLSAKNAMVIHNNADHRALGEKRAKKRAWACRHTDKHHYGNGLCANCYHLAYYYKRRAELAAAGQGAAPAWAARRSRKHAFKEGMQTVAAAVQTPQTTDAGHQAPEEEKKQR